MSKLFTLISFLLITLSLEAQMPGAGGGSRNGQSQSSGRFYGKIIDAKTNKPVDAASVQLIQNKFDTVTKKRKDVIIAGQLTKANGDFSLENLPTSAQFKLRISAMGYKQIEQSVKFEFKPGGDMASMMNAFDKDLGNLKLETDIKEMSEVKVTASKPMMQMGVDRRIFNVDKNLVSVGQTANELMRNVPGVNVDIDGNVTLRNASPTIFVDGRPTTLTLDQIPSDAIESVELITNPSAKYDASGGNAGIINIVLKKNRKAGYNGSLRAGIDSRAKLNGGGDINIKQEQVNFFASANVNQRLSKSVGYSYRQNLFDDPNTVIEQDVNSKNEGLFAFGRIGMDWFINNRNTLTISANAVRGSFDSEDEIWAATDSLYNPKVSESSYRLTENDRWFRNLGTTLGYKKLFTKAGMELTADFNYNSSENGGDGNFSTTFYDAGNNIKGNPSKEKVNSEGTTKFYVGQVDFATPIGKNGKLETGLRGAIREVKTRNTNFLYNYTLDMYIPLVSVNANYEYLDQVYAGYVNYASKVGKKFTYQAGLRIESSQYEGTLLTTKESFENSYPFSFFPSVFLTYKLSDRQDLQLNYSRRINRPNFFQLIPFIDYTDSLNVSVGNPGLLPEFTNSFELSYAKTFDKGHSLLTTAYYKRTDDLITRYQVLEENPVTDEEIVVNTYINASNSRSFGLEFTSKNPLATWLELTSNLNVYNSKINGSNIQEDLSQEQWSFFAKMNANFKLPQNFTIQLSGDYQSKSVLPQGGGGGGGMGGGRPGGGGGGGWMGGTATTAQGYINPNYGVDIAVRKDLFKEKKGSISLSMNDIFKTRKYSVHSESEFFIQDSWRRRDWRLVRLNFTYRFGKFDTSLFKRKNMKGGMEGMQEGMMQ